MRALYEIEIGHADTNSALQVAFEEANLPSDMQAYAERLVRGIRTNIAIIDHKLASIIKEYDYNRIAAVDRNVLRVAAYELLEIPEMPPAVTINEAIEIARRYSTAESGKFVNGVLGKLLQDSPKSHWDPATAPFEVDEVLEDEPDPEIVEEVVDETSAEGKLASKFGTWKLRTGEKEQI
jgi:N utilization substance protein B